MQVACPFIYGSFCTALGKKTTDLGTHRWTLFLRGPNDEDMSCFVSKVVFTLHPSFVVPVREVTNSPFEVTEVGWGEFEAAITIHFHDPDEAPVELLHTIKFYHPDARESDQNQSKKPVMYETYDEIVFTDPKLEFKQCLMMYCPPSKRIRNEMSVRSFFLSPTIFYSCVIIMGHYDRTITHHSTTTRICIYFR
jgi:YEATS domain-containing protein 4